MAKKNIKKKMRRDEHALPITSSPTVNKKNSLSMTAAEAAKGFVVNVDAEPYLDQLEAATRTIFLPDRDLNRQVQIIVPLRSSAELRMQRLTTRNREGGYINMKWARIEFGPSVFHYPHRKQVTVVLVNGQELVGYVVKNPVRFGMYFPLPFIPAGFPLPLFGKIQPFLVSHIIFG